VRIARHTSIFLGLAAILCGGCADLDPPKHAEGTWEPDYHQRTDFAWWTPTDPMLDLWTLPYPPPPGFSPWSDPFSDARRHYGNTTEPDLRWSR
jgi:hypothetical protein